MARRRIRWDRIALVIIPLFVILLLLFTQCGKDKTPDESTNSEHSGAVNSVADQLPVGTEDAFIVVIDAGHGGYDGGSTADGVTRLEKDDNLQLALRTEERLKEYDGVTVLMTRSNDEFISLEDRCKLANDAGADLFVSLHRNCAEVGNGVEIWIDSAEDRVDRLLAEYILELLDDVGISRNRGLKYGFRGVTDENSDNESDSYYVNAHTDMPSCLIELGFLTAEEDNINFDAHLEEYAEAIARGIVELGTDEGLYYPATLR